MTKQMPRELTRQQYLDLYYYMRLNRAVEDTMVKLFRQNKIVGGLYFSLGQEAGEMKENHSIFSANKSRIWRKRLTAFAITASQPLI